MPADATLKQPEFPSRDGFIRVEDYLAGEEESEIRHEYVGGRVFAMAGASEPHEIVALNLASALLNHVRGRGCRVFKGDMKVRLFLNQQDLFCYPDIMVVCDPADREPSYKKRPKVLVEIMADYKQDHVEKLFAYQQIESLEEYLIVDQNPDQARAWLYRRETGWQQEDGAPDGKLQLGSLGFETALKELYVTE